MILKALYELAQRKQLLENPDFETKPVDYMVRLASDGRALALVPMQDERGHGKELLVPRFPRRAVNIAPGFFVDNVKYVLGLGGKKAARDQECLDAFRAEVEAAALEIHDAGASAVAAFYQRYRRGLPKSLLRPLDGDWKGSEVLAFSLDGDGARPVHLRPQVKRLWSKKRSAQESEGEVGRCLITGDVGPIARLHPAIKRVPEAQQVGASIVSFNAEAFESRGLVQGMNAPISRAAAEGYVTALNWLLEGTEQRRHRYGVPLGDGAVTVFWTREDTRAADLFVDLFSPTEADAVHFAESVRRGLAPSDLDDTAFYAMTVGGNAGRVVVRDWFQSTVSEVKHNIRRYFADLQIGSEARPLPMWALLKCVEAPGGRGLPPAVATKLMGAALRGRPLPRELLAAALRRLRLPRDEKNDRSLTHERCALIKAVLIRLPHSGTMNLEVSVSLDESNVRPSYLLGRLFAVLEYLQQRALGGDVNATIRDRYFGAAAATPAVVFPRLLRLSVHHASKANSPWLESLKGKIIARLPAEPFPSALCLEDQGLFAIGYYHQRESFFEKRPAAQASEAAIG